MFYNYCVCCNRTWTSGYPNQPSVIQPKLCYQCGEALPGQAERRWRPTSGVRTATHCEHGQRLRRRTWP